MLNSLFYLISDTGYLFPLGLIGLGLLIYSYKVFNLEKLHNEIKSSKEYKELEELKSLGILNDEEFGLKQNELFDSNQKNLVDNVKKYRYLTIGFVICTTIRPLFNYLFAILGISYGDTFFLLNIFLFFIGLIVALMQIESIRNSKFISIIKNNKKIVAVSIIALILSYFLYDKFVRVKPEDKATEFAKERCEIDKNYNLKMIELLENFSKDFDNKKYSSNQLAQQIFENTIKYPNEKYEIDNKEFNEKLNSFKDKYKDDYNFISIFESSYSSYNCEDSFSSKYYELNNTTRAKLNLADDLSTVETGGDAGDLPFIGTRYFNYYGGSGTNNSITIYANGQTTVKSIGTAGEFVDYEGDFNYTISFPCGDISTCYYKINGNTISIVDENGNIQQNCKGDNTPCTAILNE